MRQVLHFQHHQQQHEERQRDERHENDEQNDHHDLFSGGVLSVRRPIGSGGFEHWLCAAAMWGNHAVRHRLYVTGIDLYLRRRLLPTPIGRDVRPRDLTSLENLHTNYTPPP